MTWQQTLEQMEQDAKRMRERADEVSEAPERIWARPQEPGDDYGNWGLQREALDSEYIRADKAMQWNDNMDEAPRDGTEILGITALLPDSKPRFFRWYTCPSGLRKGMKYWALRGTGTPVYPTHWMPLPEPPR